VDYEEKMINKSGKRISRLTSKFRLFNQNIKDFKFNRKYDIVVSVLAIHHLTDSEKKKLFIKIFNNMNKGGIFVIGDAYHLVPESKNKEILGWWENHLKKAFGEKEGKQFFRDTLKHDIYSTRTNQLKWMKKAGFSGPTAVWKKYNYAVLVARK
jgi:tRNA (cmo5U34)-methyltransferase